MKIALFGGSFNPPHVCHVLASTWVLSTRDVDRVWLMPTFAHAFGKPLVDFELRCRMVELATKPLGENAVLSRVEGELGGRNRTIDTLDHLVRVYPEDEFSLVIGADILLEAHKWKQFERIQAMVKLHVLGREGFEVDGRAPEIELPDVSSTAIRQHLRRGEIDAVRPWVPRKVLDFIVEHGLYGVTSRDDPTR